MVNHHNNQVYYCVHRELSTDLALWWIDDCFTNRTQDGGYLPMVAIKNKQVDPDEHGNSADIYEMLLAITQEQGISFYVCSFE